jgi:hypothetical protein
MDRRRPVVALLLTGMLAACADGASSPSGATSVLPTVPATPSPTASETDGAPATALPSPTAVPVPAWTELDADGPSAREDHTWTVDGRGQVAYLFGGRDGATVHADLWAYELGADRWKPVEVDGGPAARFGHEAVWVDGIGLVVIFGQAGTTFFDDLWAFDPDAAAWRQLPSTGAAPLARYGSCAALAPDGRLWISHGFTSDGTRFADTRAYDFPTGAWTDVTPAGDVPVNRCLHGCWWTDGGGLALYAGQTTGVTALGDRWELVDGSWTLNDGDAPPERNLAARARLDGATLVFGGQGLDGGYLEDGWWLLDHGGDAVALTVDGAPPPPRAGAEMVVDGDRVLLFGGRNGEGALADTWELRAARPPNP